MRAIPVLKAKVELLFSSMEVEKSKVALAQDELAAEKARCEKVEEASKQAEDQLLWAKDCVSHLVNERDIYCQLEEMTKRTERAEGELKAMEGRAVHAEEELRG